MVSVCDRTSYNQCTTLKIQLPLRLSIYHHLSETFKCCRDTQPEQSEKVKSAKLQCYPILQLSLLELMEVEPTHVDHNESKNWWKLNQPQVQPLSNAKTSFFNWV